MRSPFHLYLLFVYLRAGHGYWATRLILHVCSPLCIAGVRHRTASILTPGYGEVLHVPTLIPWEFGFDGVHGGYVRDESAKFRGRNVWIGSRV